MDNNLELLGKVMVIAEKELSKYKAQINKNKAHFNSIEPNLFNKLEKAIKNADREVINEISKKVEDYGIKEQEAKKDGSRSNNNG
jgi:uncharacterized FlgJ-related protein